jgi:iron complex outermembrane receptor protein
MKGDAENFQPTLNVVWDFSSWASLKSITGYQDHQLFQNYDVDGNARDLVDFLHHREWTHAVSQEFNLYGSTQWFTWLAGSLYMIEHYNENFYPVSVPEEAGGVGLTIKQRATERVNSYSFFSDGTVPLPKNFKLFGGLRFTDDKKTMDQTFFLRAGGGNLGVPVIPIDIPLPNESCHHLVHKDSFTNLSPRYGVQWEPNAQINVYAKRSFGYNAGGENAANCANPYKAETLDTIETGVKSRWFEGRLVANVTLFRNEFKDFQIFKFVEQNPGVPLTTALLINAPRAEMLGGEFEFVVAATEQLTLNAGLSLLHSEYVKFEDIDDRTPGGPFQDLSGRQLSNAPNHTVNLGAEYTWPIAARWLGEGSFYLSTFRLRGEYYHTDYIVFRPFGHKDDGSQKNYSIVNFFATVASRDEKYELRVFGKNLTDSQYFGFMAPGGTASIGIAGGPPRTFGIELTVGL